MKIVDAGVIVELLVGDLNPDSLGDEELAAPHLLDSEVTNVLRRLVRAGGLNDADAGVAMAGFVDLVITRYPATWLRHRMWELRHNVSGYDATYIALAEMTNATALLTTDARLASAPGPRCAIQLL